MNFDSDDSLPSLYGSDLEEQLSVSSIVAEVGMESIKLGMDYFTKMLTYAMQLLSEELGISIYELKCKMEDDLELEGIIDASIAQLRATRDLL